MSEQSTTWPDLAEALFEKLTGRGAEVTYEFQNLDVYVPSVMGPNPQHAHWKLNGILKVRAIEHAVK